MGNRLGRKALLNGEILDNDDHLHVHMPCKFDVGDKVFLFDSDDRWEVIDVVNIYTYTLSNVNKRAIRYNVIPYEMSLNKTLPTGTRVICHRYKGVSMASTNLSGVVIDVLDGSPTRYNIWLDMKQKHGSEKVKDHHVENKVLVYDIAIDHDHYAKLRSKHNL